MAEVLVKQFIFDKPKVISVEYIEDSICQLGYKPLRWGIVQIDNSHIILDTVVIEE